MCLEDEKIEKVVENIVSIAFLETQTLENILQLKNIFHWAKHNLKVQVVFLTTM